MLKQSGGSARGREGGKGSDGREKERGRRGSVVWVL